ncbi:MAG: PH domain-containing protein [Herpetosiphonaceae bacterium]|nr:PH domain-containing protein [Herpetosiphonaceae bacterium]
MALQPKLKPEGDERWMYVARRHWIALLERAAIPLLVGAVAAIIFVVRGLTLQPDFLGNRPPLLDLLSLLLILLGLAMLVIVAYTYFDWQNDFLILSNKRVILEDRTLFLRYDYETILLERVQNVNLRQRGLQKLLGYGNVTVQAAGSTAPIVFTRARRPAEIQQQVMKEVNREKREQEKRRLDAVAQRRLNPQAPPIPVPKVPVEEGLKSSTHGLESLLPLRPMFLNGTTIVWHRHWIVLLRRLLWPLLLFALWLVVLVVLPKLLLLAPGTTTILLFVSLIGILGFAAWQWEDWRNDVYMLDPNRLIDLQRRPLGLSEDRKEASLGAIQNVNAISPNLLARVLGYGDVEIETAGTSGNLVFLTIAQPQQVQRVVFEYMDRHKWSQKERDWNTAIDIVESYNRVQSPPQP